MNIYRFNQQSVGILKAHTYTEKEKILDELAAQNPDSLPNGDADPVVEVHKSKKVCFCIYMKGLF